MSHVPKAQKQGQAQGDVEAERHHRYDNKIKPGMAVFNVPTAVGRAAWPRRYQDILDALPVDGVLFCRRIMR